MDNKTVTMAHGAGGRQTSELIDEVFKAHFSNPDLTADDAAVLPACVQDDDRQDPRGSRVKKESLPLLLIGVP